jgi:hypothetical protein
VTEFPSVNDTLLVSEYAPPPPPPPEYTPPTGVPPPPPPPMTSIVFLEDLQSEGTVHVVPEVRKMVFFCPSVTPLFVTVIEMFAVAVLFDVSRAIAEMVCASLMTVVLSHTIEYGAVVTSAPTLEPSTWN